MADETLRLAATVEDRATGPLRKIQEVLNGFKPTPGMRAMREEMEALRKNVQAVGGAAGIGGGLWGGVLATGLTGGVAAGVTAAISSLDAYAKKVLEVRHLARETGMGASDLKAFEKVGERFQIPKEQIDSGLKNWAATIDEIRRRRGEAYGQLQQREPALAEQLVNEKDTKKALGLYLSFLSKIKDAQAQKQWAELPGLQGFERLFVAGPEEFRKKWAEVVSTLGKGSGDLEKQAEAFEHAIDRINDSLDKLTKRGAGPVLGWLATGLDSLGATMKQRGDEVDWFLDKMNRLRAAMGSAPDVDLSKSALLERKQRELRDLDTTITARESAPIGDRDVSQEKQLRQKLVDEIKRLTDEMAKARETQAQKMSFDTTQGGGTGGGFGGLIQNASFGGGGLGGGGGGGNYGLPRDAIDRTRRAVRDLDGGDGGRAIPAVPDTVPMTPAERNTLGLIMKYESAGRNVMNGTGVKEGVQPTTKYGHTAQGYFQLLNTNWRKIAPGLGIKTPNAMAARWRSRRVSRSRCFRSDKGQRGGSVGELGELQSGSPGSSGRGERVASGSVPSGRRRSRLIAPGGTPARTATFRPSGRVMIGQRPPARSSRRTLVVEQARARPLQLGERRPSRWRRRIGNASVGYTDGTVKVDITAHGFGENLRARTAMDGIVGSVKLNRGSAMPTASNQD